MESEFFGYTNYYDTYCSSYMEWYYMGKGVALMNEMECQKPERHGSRNNRDEGKV